MFVSKVYIYRTVLFFPIRIKHIKLCVQDIFIYLRDANSLTHTYTHAHACTFSNSMASVIYRKTQTTEAWLRKCLTRCEISFFVSYCKDLWENITWLLSDVVTCMKIEIKSATLTNIEHPFENIFKYVTCQTVAE